MRSGKIYVIIGIVMFVVLILVVLGWYSFSHFFNYGCPANESLHYNNFTYNNFNNIPVDATCHDVAGVVQTYKECRYCG